MGIEEDLDMGSTGTKQYDSLENLEKTRMEASNITAGTDLPDTFKYIRTHSICLLFACMLLPTAAEAVPCSGMWTWVSGSNITNQYGVYGIKGVPAPDNIPGARNSSISWIDAGKNLWLFGGNGYAASGSFFYLNDLWKYDGANWTWVSGSNATGQYGVYGTKGVAASGNIPGARFGGISWIDSSGNLWLFGGFGYAASGIYHYLNDLWKYDGVNWTWVCGSNTTDQYGVYGTKGIAASGNIPGARNRSISWIDAIGNFWLFGGIGYAASGSTGFLNDLWKYDGANWTWVSGSNTINQYGVYGTTGIPASGNIPGARNSSISWIDGSGNLWLFGGNGYDASGSYSYLNDLWKYDGTYWTWISGSNAIIQGSVYGTKGVPAPTNIPGARYGSISWIDGSGILWLFGGFGNTTSGVFGYLNDVWKYDGTNWTWVSGSNATGQYSVYGTKGVAAPGNIPGARELSISWIDDSGNMWLFGGNGYAASGSLGRLNDLWKFGIPEGSADMTGDGVVNGIDLRILTDQWLDIASGTVSADIYPQPAGDGIVNFQDFAVFTQHWLDDM